MPLPLPPAETALKTFSAKDYVAAGYDPAIAQIIVEQVTVIQIDESTHLKSLSNAVTALGGTPADKACKFDLSAAMKDPATFLATARTLEQVGVGGYLGAASLLSDPAVLTTAGSILTIEARHSALLNTFAGGGPVSQAFDIAMTPPQVLALAGGFLQGCQSSDLGLTTNQPLSVMDAKSKSTSFAVGSQLTLASTEAAGNMTGMSCQLLTGGAVSAMVQPAEDCKIPKGMSGVSLSRASERMRPRGRADTKMTDTLAACRSLRDQVVHPARVQPPSPEQRRHPRRARVSLASQSARLREGPPS